MAQIKTRFGTLNLADATKVPIILQPKKSEGDTPVQSTELILTNLKLDTTSGNLTPLGRSIVDIVKPLTSDPPLANMIQLNNSNKLEITSLHTSRLEQDGALILDSESSTVTTYETATLNHDTNNYYGGNK